MLHDKRTWNVREYDVSAEQTERLAKRLTEEVMPPCAGFKYGPVYLLNDSTSVNGAQEYALVIQPTDEDEPLFLQVESITFSWMERADAAVQLQQKYLEYAQPNSDRPIEVPVEPELDWSPHHRCDLCL